MFSLLITTSCKLAGPFLPLSGEHEGFGFSARGSANNNPAPHFQRVEAMAHIALVSLQGAHQFLMAARDPPLCPLVVSGQPAEDAFLQL
jgi:hypothetical protein